MINFLVKLANLLDTRGQYNMAREVDDLIEKIGQMSSVDQGQSLPEDAPQPTPQPAMTAPTKSFEDLVNAIGEANQGGSFMSGLRTCMGRSEELKRLYNTLNSDLKSGLSYDTATHLRQMSPSVISAFQKLGPSAAGVAQEWLSVMEVVDGLPRLPASAPRKAPAPDPASAAPSAASKAPAKHKPSSQTRALIMRIQKNLGVKQTGGWDIPTNQKFVEFMNSEPKYKEMMTGGKFNGTLQQAVQMTDALATIKEMDSAEQSRPSKAPAVKQEDDAEIPGRAMWKSKWHKMTPSAIGYLTRFEKAKGPGSAQTKIDAIDKVPSQTQADFEDLLKDAAESAEDTSGRGRLNDTYRRR